MAFRCPNCRQNVPDESNTCLGCLWFILPQRQKQWRREALELFVLGILIFFVVVPTFLVLSNAQTAFYTLFPTALGLCCFVACARKLWSSK